MEKNQRTSAQALRRQAIRCISFIVISSGGYSVVGARGPNGVCIILSFTMTIHTYIPYHTILKAACFFARDLAGNPVGTLECPGFRRPLSFSLAASVVGSFGAMVVRCQWRGHDCAHQRAFCFLNLTILARKIVFRRCVRFASCRRAIYFYRSRL